MVIQNKITNGIQIFNFYCGENNDQWKLIHEVEELKIERFEVGFKTVVKTEDETEVKTEDETQDETQDETEVKTENKTEDETEVKFLWSRDPEEYKTQLYRELAGKAIIYPIESVAPIRTQNPAKFSFILALDVSPEAQHNKAIDKSKYKTYTWVVADLTSSLMIMIGIFFPSGGISNWFVVWWHQVLSDWWTAPSSQNQFENQL